MTTLLRVLRLLFGVLSLGAAFYGAGLYLPLIFKTPAPGIAQIVAGGALIGAAFFLGVVLLFPQVLRVALTTYRGYLGTKEAADHDHPLPPVADARDFSLTINEPMPAVKPPGAPT